MNDTNNTANTATTTPTSNNTTTVNGYNVSYTDPLDYGSYKVESTTNTNTNTGAGTSTDSTGANAGANANSSANVNTGTGNTSSTGTSTSGGSGTANSDELKMDFKEIDRVVDSIDGVYKKINNKLDQVNGGLKKLMKYIKDDVYDKEVKNLMQRLDKRKTYNNTRVKQLRSSINSDVNSILVANIGAQEKIAQKMAELEKALVAQSVYNQNLQTALNNQAAGATTTTPSST